MAKFRESKNFNRNIITFVFGMRVVFAFTVFLQPLTAFLISLFLDMVDARIVRGFNAKMKNYSHIDKIADLAVNTVFLVFAAYYLPGILPLIFTIAYCWRAIGVIIFSLTDKRWLFLVFSNAFYEYFGVISLILLVNKTLVYSDITMVTIFVIVFLLKIPYEWAYHVGKYAANDHDVEMGHTFVNRLLN